MPRISLSTATPLPALRAWEGNLVIAGANWAKVSKTLLQHDMAQYECSAIQCFAHYIGRWPEFQALGLAPGEDEPFEANVWHDGMGEMLDLLPEHWHLEFVYLNDLSLLLFGTQWMFSGRGRGKNNAGGHRSYEFRYTDPRAVVKMRLEEQLVAVRARIVAGYPASDYRDDRFTLAT